MPEETEKLFEYHSSLEKLRIRAEKIRKELPVEKKNFSYNEVHKLINDLELYQIELQLQNEDLKNSLLQVEDSHNRYADLYDFIPFGYFTLTSSGNILEVNEVGASLLGIKKNHLYNLPFSRYISSDSQYIFLNHIQNTLEKMALQTCEITMIRKEGPLFYAQIESIVRINSINKEKILLTFVRDISEKRKKDEFIQTQQNKMSVFQRNISIEKFASVIVHELNHPLSINANYLYGCIHRLESGDFNIDEIIDSLKKAADQTHRAADIILKMKNFTYKNTLKYEIIDLNDLIKDSIALIDSEIFECPISIHYQPSPYNLYVQADKIHIQQVILNLARNAFEAMRDAKIVNPKLIIEINKLNMNIIEVSIIDNGPGIDDGTIYKLFNPYFSTKPYGVGLGLSICHSIIQAHGGQLSVEEGILGGACFKFTLPYKHPK